MGTTLRLGFALGGGVSLGTFCGAALSESIKLLLLYGKDRTGEPYERILIDVFSGASAGAMSLGLMLRALADPDPARRPKAEANLARLYGADFTGLPAGERRDDLIAAQILQDMQREVWVERINIRSLLGRNGRAQRDISREPSLLDSEAVTRIAGEMMRLPSETGFPNRRLLSDRVLYACTLANLCPVVADARGELPGPEVGFIGLTDGMRSSVRRDLRVFDLNFALHEGESAAMATAAPHELAAQEEALHMRNGYPSRWCRYDEAPEKPGQYGDLRLQRTWKKITATAVASGSFPFAFKPVVLIRNDYEYGANWPKALRDQGLKEYPFSYFDGGTFNNEPIREAFRMAAFLDGHSADAGFERRIIFVDPFVSEEDLSLRVPVHATRGLMKPASWQPFDGYDLVEFSSVDRLMVQAGNIVAALSDEARVIEADRIFQTRKRFELRNQMRSFLSQCLSDAPTDAVFKSLRAYCEGLLSVNRVEAQVPPGTLTLASEMERVIREEMPHDPALGPLAGRAAAFLKKAKPSEDPHAALWLRVQVAAALDLSMDLEGKSNDAQLIAIAPFSGMRKYLGDLKSYRTAYDAYVRAKANAQPGDPEPSAPPRPAPKTETLYGGPIHGFAGFMSETVRARDFETGIRCALEFLDVSDMLQNAPASFGFDTRPLDWSKNPLAAELKEGVDGLADRVSDSVRASHLINLGLGLDGAATAAIALFVGNWIKKLGTLGRPSQAYELRIRVDGDHLNLDGTGLNNDIKPLELNPGERYLVTFANYFPPDDGKAPLWDGPHIKSDSLSRRGGNPNPEGVDGAAQIIEVSQDVFGGVFDRFAFSLRVPDEKVRTCANVYPNPILVCDARRVAQGQRSAVLEWTPLPGAQPLEEAL